MTRGELSRGVNTEKPQVLTEGAIMTILAFAEDLQQLVLVCDLWEVMRNMYAVTRN